MAETDNTNSVFLLLFPFRCRDGARATFIGKAHTRTRHRSWPLDSIFSFLDALRLTNFHWSAGYTCSAVDANGCAHGTTNTQDSRRFPPSATAATTMTTTRGSCVALHKILHPNSQSSVTPRRRGWKCTFSESSLATRRLQRRHLGAAILPAAEKSSFENNRTAFARNKVL